MKKIVLFASGSGTNAENIILHFKNNGIAKITAVFSNNSNAFVLERAKNHGVSAVVFTKEELKSGTILQILQELQPDLIVLAGFLLQFPENIIKLFPDKIINIHPALLPKYGGKGMYGMHVHKAVLDNKETETGISIHYVNENYDEGKMIFQKSTVISNCTSSEEIAAKIHELEQQYFPQVIENLIKEQS